MANLSDDTLRKILQQIQQQAVVAQKSLSMVKAQIQSKERERRILELTIRQLATVPAEENARMFKGVGKMFLFQPTEEVHTQNEKQEKALADEIVTLQKKAKYLDKQFQDAQNQLRDIFHSQKLAQENQ